MAHNKLLGDFGEQQAIKYLKRINYKIIEKNYRCKFGELDVIAQDNKTLVFVEIKTRISTNFGFPSEAVDYNKRKRIIKIAQYYLMYKKTNLPVRFDVVEVIAGINGNDFYPKKIVLIKNAFGV